MPRIGADELSPAEQQQLLDLIHFVEANQPVTRADCPAEFAPVLDQLLWSDLTAFFSFTGPDPSDVNSAHMLTRPDWQAAWLGIMGSSPSESV